ncbi:MAG: hypothetical protein ACOH1Y_15915 [Propionicimonas sp.]
MAFSSISFLTQALVMSVFGSRLTTRFGTRAVVITGGVFSGAMIFAVSFVTTLPALYAFGPCLGPAVRGRHPAVVNRPDQ